MKKLLNAWQHWLVMVLVLMVFNQMIMAQAVINRNTIPPFHIQLTNTQFLKANGLKQNEPVMLLYFDPTCDHCRVFTADLLKHYQKLKSVQIVMISYTPVSEVKKFEKDFNLTKYPNIKVGTEGTSFVVQRFYGIQKFPFTAFFGRGGQLKAAYRDAPPVEDFLLTMAKG